MTVAVSTETSSLPSSAPSKSLNSSAINTNYYPSTVVHVIVFLYVSIHCQFLLDCFDLTGFWIASNDLFQANLINFTQQECTGSNQYWSYTIQQQRVSIHGEPTTGDVNGNVSEIVWSNSITYSKGIDMYNCNNHAI